MSLGIDAQRRAGAQHGLREGGRARVAMATSDKHCQTPSGRAPAADDAAMFDESVAVEGREVDSSASSEGGPVRAAMSKFRPPARHDFGTDSDSDGDAGSDSGAGRLSAEEQSLERKVEPAAQQQQQRGARTSDSDSESDEDAEKRELVVGAGGGPGGGRRRAPPAHALSVEGAYDPEQFRDLKVPPELENLFQYITKYTPQKMEAAARLRAFVPECAPAVGDCDALLKLCTPSCTPRRTPPRAALHDHIDNLGLAVLDEPAAQQSDPAVLHLQLRALCKSSAGGTTLTKKIADAESNPKAIERWIRDVSELHAAGAAHAVVYEGKMPEVDSLMEEWPARVEAALAGGGLPAGALQCPLAQYAQLTCALFDVPVRGPAPRHRLHALHLLFTLYSAVRGSQLFAERRRD